MSGIDARPQRMSTTAAIFRVIVTLAMFLAVFIPFLIAPLLALGIGYLVYAGARSRAAVRPRPSGPAQPTTPRSASGFGAGAS